jgi:hypothetical protein
MDEVNRIRLDWVPNNRTLFVRPTASTAALVARSAMFVKEHQSEDD